MKPKNIFVFLLIIAGLAASVCGQNAVRPTESGGPLMAEQAAYDVKSYDLAVGVDVAEHSIRGILTASVMYVKPLDKLVLDLDEALTVDSAHLVKGRMAVDLKFERRGGKIWIELGKTAKKGERIDVAVAYHGIPKVAPRPPWVGGFVWSKTKDGEPWFATAVQMDGADLWWPVKDHPSDKPDTVKTHFTVPAPLVVASNGRLESVVDNPGGTRTYNWFVSQPISNYCIAMNVAPYKVIKDSVKSIGGDTIPIEFYVLPQDFDKGQSLVDKLKDYTRFFEQYLGPYPFRADKIGVAETPHLGMEHQTITAYGNEFRYDKNGFDWLLFHEFGHEWWANLVTAPDWNDFWIHEGFESFMDAFYAEKMLGREQFVKSLPQRIKSLKNLKPVAPRESRTTTQMYMIPPEYVRSDGDIYGKGALVLNALRGYLGDDAFFRSLRRFTYPDPKMEKVTDGRQFHFGTTDDFLRIAEKQSGKKLGWFFELYLRQPALPKLVVEQTAEALNLRWETPNNMPFPLPVEVKVNGETKRVAMTGNQGTLAIPADAKVEIDPNGWLLKQ
ncbi:MAG: M1 family metallopeptidase [Acidobacteria bacterium]|nr:M1 family metallopeptidase [Acidobacteriota bacterium]